MRVIPAIDLIGGSCVRLLQGDYRRQRTYPQDAAEQALRFQEAGFSRLHVIDLEGARDGEGRNRSTIGRILQRVRVPVQVGGGIRTGSDVEELLRMGASFLILGTAVVKDPGEAEEWIRKWGAERFIVSLDLRGGRLQAEGWREESREDLDSVLSCLEGWGIRQIICTDVERDGSLQSPNYGTYENLALRLPGSVEIIAAGGVSRLEQVRRLGEIGLAGAVMGRALYEQELNWKELADVG